MPEAPASQVPTDTLKSNLEEMVEQTGARLERGVALVAITLATLTSIAIPLGRLAGSHVPLRILAVTVPLILWYVVIWYYTRTERYSGRLRYVSTLIEISTASGLILIDLADAGPLYALTASGPSVYALSVTISSLRLDSRLSVLAGVLGAAQYLAIMLLVVQPRAMAEGLPAFVLDPVVLASRTSFILATGILGYIITRTSRSLIFHLSRVAVERERMRGLFGMHVSEQVMEYLLSGGIPEGGERRSVTICFTDIRGFTSLSESREPEELVRLLNLYFSRMCDVVARHGGVVNKFLGDGMLVVFGAPSHLPDDARKALRAAQEMLDESNRMNRSGEFPGLRIGIGLHRGEVVVGNVGGDQRREYTVIGDTVNTASRVQDLTKPLGRELLFTREVRDALDSGTYEPLGQHTVKGREAPLDLFTLPTTAVQAA